MGGFDFMSRKGIITTYEGRKNAPLGKYQFPPKEGSFTGTLVYRAWHQKSPCLICYFDTDDGEHFMLLAWNNHNYSPRKSDISFADDVTNGSRWKCEFSVAKGGSISWLTADEMAGEV